MRRLQSLVGAAQGAVSAEAYRNGYTPKSLEETQRDVLWWVYARVQAALNARPSLAAGWGIAWTSSGYAELVPVEVPRAGRDRVTVRVLCSSISPGTERAQYLRLPNAQVGVLGRPGYSAVGEVLSLGPRVSHLARGDLVAVTGAPHASLVNAPGTNVFKVPTGVLPEHASLIMLGTICVNGARLVAGQTGQRVAVVGGGPIGILALRMASRHAEPVAVIATSRRAETLAAASGAPLLTSEDDGQAISQLEADVVIEATGDPQGVHRAVEAAAERGRIVLLGSSRGLTRDLPVEKIRRKRLRLIGAHVDTLDLRPTESGLDARRAAGEEFLGLVAAQELPVADLIGPAVDPRRAAAFYRDLAEGKRSGGAHFDWRLLPPGQAVSRTHILRPPNVLGRGVEPTRPLRPRRSEAAAWWQTSDPFAGATGRLRLGLVGCGDIAVHNAAGAAAAPNVELVACFDPVPRLAEDLANRHGATALASFEDMLAARHVDALVLSVPHDLHAPLAIEACRAGKNVIVEKPLARDLAGALEMAQAARENNVWLSPCFPQRYEAKVQFARALVEQGAVGEVQGTLTRLFLDKSPAYWRGGFSGRAQSDWRSLKERAGGGVLIMNLSHHLDLMRYLSGLEVEEVVALTQPPEGVEDSALASLRYAGGALGSVVGSSNVRGSTEESMSLWGTEGRLILEPLARVFTLRPVSGLRTTRWQSFGRLPARNIRAVYFSRLATAVSQGGEPEIKGDDGVAVQATIEAVYRAGAEESSVDVSALVREGRQTALAVA